MFIIYNLSILENDGYMSDEMSYKELMPLHDYVTKTLGQKSVVIDADDLVANPGKQPFITRSLKRNISYITRGQFKNRKQLLYAQVRKINNHSRPKFGRKTQILVFFFTEGILRCFCAAGGLDFQESMLTWNALSPEDNELFTSLGGACWFSSVVKSIGFEKGAASTPRDLSNYTQEVRDCVREMIPYYENMKKLKLLF